MSTFSGCLTGEGTPLNQRTGRRQTYRSSSWRNATFNDADAAADGRGQRAFDTDDQILAEGLDGLIRQPALNCLKAFSPA